ncbi:hypothetical protein Hanom_Chr00s001648g01684721 [Helianthus anomalus]
MLTYFVILYAIGIVIWQRIAGNYNYLIEEEIEDLVKSCGFTNYTCKVQQAFIMFSAQKP